MAEGISRDALERGEPRELTNMLSAVLTPILVLIGLMSALGVVMWYLGRYPTEMLLATTALCGPAVLAAAFLLHRQGHAGKTTLVSLTSAEARVAGIVESA